ncbi:RNA binding protein (contains RRM repeats) protein [Dioscorea alata]|uniref:RNA binding protein (Contains RRM repeats) protein n=1 Tax=Dioscorea alata TaxID=55571 RepID=A0ACB7VL57_DIOAL|nr:RNA binding protein (contains RRM repeats) protein [Dioscorea alata]
MAGAGLHPYHQPWAAPPPPPPAAAIAVENPNRPSSDEVRTIFISGLPEDVKERELHNLLRWLPGFEASQINYKGEQPMGFALFTMAQHAMAAKNALQDLVFDAETKSVLHTEMAKKNLFVKRGVVNDSSSFDQSKRMRTGGDYTHAGYPSPSPFHPPPAPVWGGHGYIAPPAPYDPYAGYPVAQVPMPPPTPVPAPSGYAPIQNNKDNAPCNTLFIGNLGENVNEEELRGLFIVQPGYKQMKVLRQERNTVCFIEFEDVSSATVVHQNLQGAVLTSSGRGGMRIQYPSIIYEYSQSYHPINGDFSQIMCTKMLVPEYLLQNYLTKNLPDLLFFPDY